MIDSLESIAKEGAYYDYNRWDKTMHAEVITRCIRILSDMYGDCLEEDNVIRRVRAFKGTMRCLRSRSRLLTMTPSVM